MTSGILSRGQDTQKHREGHVKLEAGRSDTAQGQRMCEATRSPKRLGRVLSSGLGMERGPPDPLISAFWSPEECKDEFLLS